MTYNIFIEELEKIGIKISNQQMIMLNQYYKMLEETNSYMNLTTIIKEEEVYLKHFYDSLTLNKVIDLNKVRSLCDIGTGAGFPGLVIKILFPDIEVTLVDSLNKRLEFLKKVIETLNIKNIKIIHSRIEDYGIKNREKYDCVTARAVAPLNILIEYSLPLVKVNGYFIAMKANIYDEIDNSTNALKLLGASIEKIEKFYLPLENSQRTLIKIIKQTPTKKTFPRKYNEIKKKPL